MLRLNHAEDKSKKHRSPPRRSALFSPSATSRLLFYSSSLTAAGPIVENTGYRFPRIGENCCRYSVRAPPLAPGAKSLVPFTAGPSTRSYLQSRCSISTARAKSGTGGSSGNEFSCLKVRGRCLIIIGVAQSDFRANYLGGTPLVVKTRTLPSLLGALHLGIRHYEYIS